MGWVGGIHAEDVAFVRVLGPVQIVTASGRSFDLPSVSQRRLLARLAVDAPRALRVDLLCDVLDVSPGALRTVVSRLRKGFGDTAVIASQGRYRLGVPVDAVLFTTMLSELGTGEGRIGTLERALALWRGPAFEEFSAEDWAAPEAARLAELHAAAAEDHAAELILTRHWPEAIAELKSHVLVHPLRDRPRGLLIQALGGAGRQADALAAFREYRAYLAESVGTEPSAEVCRIQQRIAAGWDGTEQTPPSWRGNGWLPLQAELARGPAVVGRARELELLAAEAALTAGSGSRTVIIEGEAGIGKTTVLGAFARAVQDEGSTAVLYGRCQDGPAVPLEPFRSLIGHVVEHAPAEVLRAHVTRCGGHLVRLAPQLASRAELAATPVSDDATERHLLFEAVSDLLRRLAAVSPLVVVLDDVQWAEPTAVQLLRFLSRALADAPVLLVLLVRDTDERRPRELRAVLAELERRPGRRICLGGFGDAELAGLTASLLAVDAGAVTAAVCARLQEQSAGNPLYAIQLIRHWTESGQLAVAAAEVDFAGGGAADDVPATHAGTGACGCTCCAPCTACPSASPWQARRPTNGRSCWTSSTTASLPGGRAGQVLIGDKGYDGRDFEAALAAAGLTLLRPARKGEPDPAGRQYVKPLRQVIESVNDTLKGQLDLERHGGRTVDGVTVRVLQRILALTAAIWHNDTTGQPYALTSGLRPLTLE